MSKTKQPNPNKPVRGQKMEIENVKPEEKAAETTSAPVEKTDAVETAETKAPVEGNTEVTKSDETSVENKEQSSESKDDGAAPTTPESKDEKGESSSTADKKEEPLVDEKPYDPAKSALGALLESKKPTPVEPPKAEVKVKKVADLPAAAETVAERIGKYIETMKPNKPHMNGEGVTAQHQLFKLFTFILRQRGTDFKACMDVLLDAMKEHKETVFSPRYSNRYIDKVSMSSSDRIVFENLLSLFTRCCDKRSRNENLKHFDMAKVVARITDSEAQQHLMDYFSPRI